MTGQHGAETDSDRRVDLLGTISARFVRPEPFDCDTAIRRSLCDVAAALGLDMAALVTFRRADAIDVRSSYTWTRHPGISALDLVDRTWRQDRETLSAGHESVIDTAGSESSVLGGELDALALATVLLVPHIQEGRLTTLLACGTSIRRDWEPAPVGFVRTVLNILVATLMRKETQVDLAQSEHDLDRALDLAGLGTFVFDFKTGDVHLSQTMSQMFGFGAAAISVPAAEAVERYHPEDRNYLLHLLGDVTNENPGNHVQLRIAPPDADPRLVRFTSELVRDSSGQPVALRGTALDITSVERASSELARIEEAAYRAKIEAQLARSQRLESLGLLAGGVAHDFNNLLAIISNHAALLEPVVGDDAQGRADLEAIRRTIRDAGQLARRLLTFGGRDPAASARAPLDPNVTVEENLRLLRSAVPHSVHLSLDIQPGVPKIFADPGHIQQILSNLVANASDAVSGAGHVDVRVRTERVGLEEARAGMTAGDYVVIEVADDGVGMTPEQMERAFDPFFSTKTGQSGSGLGLSIVHGIAASLFGWVRLDSQAGNGTTVTVALPAADKPDEPESEQPLDVTISGQTILVVDDHGELLRSTARLLRDAGYSVLESQSPAEAEEIVARHPGRVDLVLSDVVLPGMSGFALTARLRLGNPSLRALHVSGHVPAEHAHGTVVLQKPFEPADLLEAVRRSLRAPAG